MPLMMVIKMRISITTHCWHSAGLKKQLEYGFPYGDPPNPPPNPNAGAPKPPKPPSPATSASPPPTTSDTNKAERAQSRIAFIFYGGVLTAIYSEIMLL